MAPALSANAPLLTSLAPSTDEAMIHRRVSELRIALRAAEGALEKTRARFEDSESARHEAESESAALRARVWTLEGAEALSGARLHDGTLDLLRGELLNEATAELEEAARATADAESVREGCRRVASSGGRHRRRSGVRGECRGGVSVSPEAAQARFRAQAESRDAATGARGASACGCRSSRRRGGGFQVARHRRASHRRTQRGAGGRQGCGRGGGRGQRGCATATGARRRRRSITSGCKSRLHELEDAEGTDASAHYGAELRRLREKLTVDAAKAADALAIERAARPWLEAKLPGERDGSVPDASLAALEEQLRVEREETAKLRERLAAIGAGSTGEDSWADALGLVSDEEASEKGMPPRRTRRSPLARSPPRSPKRFR